MSETEVPGLFLLENFVSYGEEAELVNMINDIPWVENRARTRRVQIYGPYHDSRYKLIKGKYSSHPAYSKLVVGWMRELSTDAPETQDFLTDEVLSRLEDDQRCEMYTNEYNPGATLQSHFDHRSTYDECIFGVSLMSDCTMAFGDYRVVIPRRSIYFITGPARFDLKHGILDPIEEYRISLTYRTTS